MPLAASMIGPRSVTASACMQDSQYLHIDEVQALQDLAEAVCRLFPKDFTEQRPIWQLRFADIPDKAARLQLT